jgi:putative ABC transport system permease protein
MSTRRLLLQSIRYYRRTHLGVILGAALATLVLTGALMVGDSVKATLREQAEARVGKIGAALLCGERLVPWSRARAEHQEAVAGSFVPGNDSAAALMLTGSASSSGGVARANRVQIIGVDAPFWKLAPSGRVVALAGGANPEVAVNERLAAQLGVKVGGEVLVKVEKPGAISRDAPLSGEESDVITLRLRVAHILGDADFGRFALTSGQVPPFTAFVSLAALQEKLGVGGKVNLVAAKSAGSSKSAGPGPDRTARPFFDATVNSSTAKALAADFDMVVRELPQGRGFEIRTPRVFLEDGIVSAARRSEKDTRVFSKVVIDGSVRDNPPPPPGLDSLTYFVNGLHAGDGRDPKAKATPYSMVTAIDAPASGFLQAELSDDEIQITRWLADDLSVGPGDKVTIKYFVMGERRQLVEKARTFTVLAPIFEMDEPQLNGSWMPEFPGLADKENCRDWKPGFDFDATRMREKDQDFWSRYRGTPKAFVNLKVGQEMWGNRWGNLTSIRYPAGTKREQVERVAAFVDPTSLGFRVVNLRDQALAATNAPVDFGELFVYFSFFLIAAAAVLTGLLFTFTIEQRAAEAGLLLAVGWPVKKVRRLFLREGFILALIGSLVGALLAALYTKGVLQALAGVWGGATGGTRFAFSPSPGTIAIGVVSGVIVALFAMWLATRRLFRMEAAALLNGEWSGSGTAGAPFPLQQAGRLRLFAIAVACLLAAVALAVLARGDSGAFFGAGALLLIAGCLFCLATLRRMAGGTGVESLAQLGARNISRRRGRSLATIAVLASGVFMVIAVDSFRKGPLDDPARRDSGTGGFAFIGESSAPIYEDLNSTKGREAYALDDKVMADVHVVQMRVRDGDDASCLNLNRAVQPRLLGLDFAELRVKQFGLDWSAVSADADTIPGVVDASTLQWAMQRKLGDVLEYSGERGEPVRVRFSATVSGSVLQGLVIVPERDFVARFPNTAGYRFFLVDCPREKADAVREHLSRQLGDRGLELVSTAKRLAEFNAVENTYLSIFQVLGGLGVLLGSAGLGIVVARNVFERRREFGLLEAVGFTPRLLRRLVFAEHRWLIAGAVGIGAVSALLAVWPRLAAQSSALPWQGVTALIVGMAMLGAFWAWIATRLALRRSQLPALRTE